MNQTQKPQGAVTSKDGVLRYFVFRFTGEVKSVYAPEGVTKVGSTPLFETREEAEASKEQGR
jgi:hypothetical protein